jgi:hypothetical protein
MAKKLDYANLSPVKIVTTQERIAPNPNMPPVDLTGVKIIEPVIKAPDAPVAAPVVPVVEAPKVTEAVKQATVPAAVEGTPSASPDGKQAGSVSATASTDENELEIKEDELPEGIRKRFSKLTSQRKEAQARNKELEEKEKAKQALLDAKEKELEFYKEALLNPTKAPTTGVVKTEPVIPVVEEKVLKLEDFNDQEDPISAFVDAKVNQIVNKRMAPVEKQLDPAVVEAKRRVAAEVAENADFTQIVNFQNPAIKMLSENPITNAMIPASKDNLKISYYLGKNPEEARRIASMTDPIDIAIELRAIQGKIKPQAQVAPQIVVPAAVAPAVIPASVVVPEKQIEKTNAPVPFKPVSANGTAPLPDVGTLTPDQMRDDPRYAFLKKKRY